MPAGGLADTWRFKHAQYGLALLVDGNRFLITPQLTPTAPTSRRSRLAGAAETGQLLLPGSFSGVCESASKVFRAPQSCCDRASECAVKPAATAKAGGPQGPARSLGDYLRVGSLLWCIHGGLVGQQGPGS
ncbi:unnamed protein product [Arctogadus glacialis]